MKTGRVQREMTYQSLAPLAGLEHKPLAARHDPRTLEALGQNVHGQLRAAPRLLHEQREPTQEPADPERWLRDPEVDDGLRQELDEPREDAARGRGALRGEVQP